MSTDNKQGVPPETNVFSVFYVALLTSVGIYTTLFSPLPMIQAHFMLAKPWSRVAVMLGAVLALAFLQMPMPFVMVSFVFGFVLADGVSEAKEFWWVLLRATSIALLVSGLLVGAFAYSAGMPLFDYWSQFIDQWISSYRDLVSMPADFPWASVQDLLRYEGPFLLVQIMILSACFSIGVSAHLGWLPLGHPLCADGLRKLKPSWWLSLGFVVAAGLALALADPKLSRLASSVVRVLGSCLFVLGLSTYSTFLVNRSVGFRGRTLAYVLGIGVGFYGLVLVGLMRPWWSLRKRFKERK